MMYGYDMYGYGMWGFGLLWMLVFWGAVIWFVVWLINRNKEPERQATSSIEILKQRYAKGEITKKEYEEMKNAMA